MTNTEKPTTKAEAKKQHIEVAQKKQIIDTPKVKAPEKKPEEENSIQKSEEVKKNPIIKKEKSKKRKEEAIVRAKDIPISTKKSVAVCKFIVGKKISDAIRDLEQVIIFKKSVPMKGEIPHRKGKIMSGAYPQKVVKNFIVLLKSLASNSADIENPIIVEAVANMGSRPYGRFGRFRKKRTHIVIKAVEKNKINKKNKTKK
ncbi:MAG: hypothetical protein KKB31_03240 [Nanoarchaeota archaeon]|nr:hypothetical protein [Nanoarchaeota archaeon]